MNLYEIALNIVRDEHITDKRLIDAATEMLLAAFKGERPLATVGNPPR